MTFTETSIKITASLVLFCVLGCSSNIVEIKKTAATDAAIQRSVAKSIQDQLQILEGYADEDILSLLGAAETTGEEVVSKALGEDGGADYIDFCHAANMSFSQNDSSYVMEKARGLMNAEDYNRLKKEIDDNEKALAEWGCAAAKGMNEYQAELFYRDLKELIVKSSIMLVSAIVYVAVPPTLMWGKIPAATALSIAAGVAASAVVDITGYFKKGYIPEMFSEHNTYTEGELTFQVWLEKLKASPLATHAIATAVTSYCASMGLGKIPTAIILCMFGAYNALDAIVDMKRVYNL